MPFTTFNHFLKEIPVNKVLPVLLAAALCLPAAPQAATVYPAGEDGFRLEFDEPQRAPTAGQAVVLYQGDVGLGGGTIKSVEK